MNSVIFNLHRLIEPTKIAGECAISIGSIHVTDFGTLIPTTHSITAFDNFDYSENIVDILVPRSY